MAAPLGRVRSAASSVERIAGKVFARGHLSRSPARSRSALILRRSAHTSVYDKNVEDHVHPVTVPDDVIHAQSEKYWAPHPQTGVFGPEQSIPGGVGERGIHTAPATAGGESSVLEEQAWFRPTSIEDLEKASQN